MRRILILNIFIFIFLQDIKAQNPTIRLEENDSTYVDMKFINDTIANILINYGTYEENFIAGYKIIGDTFNVSIVKDLQLFENFKFFVSNDKKKSLDSVDFTFYIFAKEFFMENEVYSKIGFDSMCLEMNNEKYFLRTDANWKADCEGTGDIFNQVKIKNPKNSCDLKLYTKHGKLIIEKKINLENKNKIMIRGLYYEGYYKIFTAKPKNVYVNDKRYFLKFI